jgi:hypothetical protein
VRLPRIAQLYQSDLLTVQISRLCESGRGLRVRQLSEYEREAGSLQQKPKAAFNETRYSRGRGSKNKLQVSYLEILDTLAPSINLLPTTYLPTQTINLDIKSYLLRLDLVTIQSTSSSHPPRYSVAISTSSSTP